MARPAGDRRAVGHRAWCRRDADGVHLADPRPRVRRRPSGADPAAPLPAQPVRRSSRDRRRRGGRPRGAAGFGRELAGDRRPTHGRVGRAMTDPSTLVRLRDIAAMLAVSGAAWYFGANVWTAVLVGGAVTIVLRAASLVSVPEEGGFRSRVERRARAKGGRSDVANLASSLSRG